MRAHLVYCCLLTSLCTAPPMVLAGCGSGDSTSNVQGTPGNDSGIADGALVGDGKGQPADGANHESGGGADAGGSGDAGISHEASTSDHGVGDTGGGGDASGGSDASRGGDSGAGGDAGRNSHAIRTVFLILMENHDWSLISGSASAPYINKTLLPSAAHAESYYNPPSIHPSLPNYLWLEAGQNFGILDDNPPSTNHQSTTAHLATQMTNAGVTWRAYEEDISGSGCPLTDTGNYAVRHDPFVYFDDITMGAGASCAQNVRPYTQLATDLAADSVAQYNFITPNVCDDMHDDKSNNSTCASTDSIQDGDTWLSTEVPKIQASSAYKNGGAIFITWDEGEGNDGPIGMIVASPLGKANGYSNTIHYTHSSTVRTMQEIFNLSPFLGDAANATDLSDLFSTFP